MTAPGGWGPPSAYPAYRLTPRPQPPPRFSTGDILTALAGLLAIGALVIGGLVLVQHGHRVDSAHAAPNRFDVPPPTAKQLAQKQYLATLARSKAIQTACAHPTRPLHTQRAVKRRAPQFMVLDGQVLPDLVASHATPTDSRDITVAVCTSPGRVSEHTSNCSVADGRNRLVHLDGKDVTVYELRTGKKLEEFPIVASEPECQGTQPSSTAPKIIVPVTPADVRDHLATGFDQGFHS